jgi:hypothetical protein
MLLRPTDLDGLSRLRVLNISECEIGDKDSNSEVDEREGKTIGELLYTK